MYIVPNGKIKENHMSKKKSASKKSAKETPAKPKQSRLPGMEDSAIEELESLAEHYATIRDKRIALSKNEGELQDDLLTPSFRLLFLAKSFLIFYCDPTVDRAHQTTPR